MHDLSSVRCVAYRRVSTEKQAGEVYTSLDDQQRACDELAGRLNVTIAQTYTDDGYSGATIEQRPALRALIDDCRKAKRSLKHPGRVLVLNDSRWGRFPNPEEGTYWRFELERHGWLVQFVENDDTGNKSIRAIMRAMVAGQATQKRDDVKANAKRGMRGSVERGYWCSAAPYGFRRHVVHPAGRERVLDNGVRKAVDERVALTPFESEAVLIRELFRRFATGEHSISSLMTWMQRVAPDRAWRFAAVRCALTNPAYVGDVVFGRVPSDRGERAIQRTRDASEWYVRRNAHPKIVDRVVFNRVQDLLARNQKVRRGVRSDWVLSGIVRCRCSAPMISGGGGRKGRKHGDGHFEPSYRCSTHNKGPRIRCSFGGTVTKDALESAVVGTIAKEASTAAARARLLALLDQAFDVARRAPSVDVVKIERERAAVALRRGRIVEAIESGVLKTADAKSRLDRLAAIDNDLLAQLDAVGTNAPDARQLRVERDRIAAMFLDLPTVLRSLAGPALRELIRPWIRAAVFNTETRVLRLEIRHIPRLHMLTDATGTPARACTETAGTDT
jgi:DNA invertase Pin-like site-specific DNA recombinase